MQKYCQKCYNVKLSQILFKYFSQQELQRPDKAAGMHCRPGLAPMEAASSPPPAFAAGRYSDSGTGVAKKAISLLLRIKRQLSS
ncbi:hypothetical protein CHU92_06525 [Flavobacterium cyanobacteriorum]|uniref:Uncharacterized protein n=1 Tax=Flavobacterium cyanobacteriorum TaxID=2022802 RepID=A0A255Z9H4_9FLAO|nr:hypothetical protein CHU92_06525 [Flavobacterium cyanobacteriorum]